MTEVRLDERGAPDLPLIVVTSDELRLVFAPTRGGRLLSLQASGTELLWQNPDLLDSDLHPFVPVDSWPRGDGAMSTWANIGGSKTWPAPQGWNGDGEWAGPPDTVLDSGEWTASHLRDGDRLLVTLTSPADTHTGLQISRSFSVPPTGTAFTERVTFTNIADRPVRWSIWEVCQVAISSGAALSIDQAAVVVPLRTDSRIIELGQWFGELPVRLSDDEARYAVGTSVAKRGFARVDGSVTYHGASGETLTLAIYAAETAEYPDGGAQVEVWFQTPTPAPIADLGDLWPSADLVELEVLGPLVTFSPGTSSSATIHWTTTGAHRSSA